MHKDKNTPTAKTQYLRVLQEVNVHDKPNFNKDSKYSYASLEINHLYWFKFSNNVVSLSNKFCCVLTILFPPCRYYLPTSS